MPTYFLQSDPANPPPGLNVSHLVETEMVGESSLTPYVCAQGTLGASFCAVCWDVWQIEMKK